MIVYFPFWHQSFFAWILKHRYATSSSWRGLVCLHCIFFLLILFVLRELLRRYLRFDENGSSYIRYFSFWYYLFYMNLYTDIHFDTKIYFIWIITQTYMFWQGLVSWHFLCDDVLRESLHRDICAEERIGLLIFWYFSFW